MPKIILQGCQPVFVNARATEVQLDAPLQWYEDLSRTLKQFKCLRRLRIQIHFAKHAAQWPYGKMDPCRSLDFLAGLNTLEELEIHYLHKLSDGSVLRSLPRLRRIVIGYETRFDLAWLCAPQIERLSVGLTKKIRYPEAIATMHNLRVLGIDNLKAENLELLRRLKELELLGIGGGVKSLDGIGGAKALRTLNLNALRFEDYGDLNELRNLEAIRVQSCYDFTSLKSLCAPRLRDLTIYGRKGHVQSLDSIKPLKHSTHLEQFVFGGVIEDGDVTPLVPMRHLKRCFIHRRYMDAVLSQVKNPRIKGAFRF